MTAACFDWRIRDNMNAIYEPIHNGAYMYWPYNHCSICCTIDKDDCGIDVKTLGHSLTNSSICKNADITVSTIYATPICSEYSGRPDRYSGYFEYSGVSFPFYSFVLGHIIPNAKIGYFTLYIPVEHIDKFTSFKLEHK